MHGIAKTPCFSLLPLGSVPCNFPVRSFELNPYTLLFFTGETLWVKRMMDKYGKKAKEKKVTVVNMSGFDSIPAGMQLCYWKASPTKHG